MGTCCSDQFEQERLREEAEEVLGQQGATESTTTVTAHVHQEQTAPELVVPAETSDTAGRQFEQERLREEAEVRGQQGATRSTTIVTAHVHQEQTAPELVVPVPSVETSDTAGRMNTQVMAGSGGRDEGIGFRTTIGLQLTRLHSC